MIEADLIVIGAGPGGYEVAAKQAAAGKKVVLIERDLQGGTCLNRGCIPTKCLCASAEMALRLNHAAGFGVNVGEVATDYVKAADRMREVVADLRANVEALTAACTCVAGEASFDADGNVRVADEVYSAPQIIIATGSRPAVPPIKGAEHAMTSDDFLKHYDLPARLVIVGGGVIGLEFASIAAAFGSEVTVIEYCKEVLPPFDREVAKRLRTMLTRRGIKFVVGAAVTEIGPDFVTYEGKKDAVTVPCDAVLMAVGRRPVVPEGLAEAGIELDKRGFIVTDERMQTTRPGVYAVGDCNGRLMLAHVAEAQAEVAVGHDVDLDTIPSAVFTIPEAAMVGLTTEQCEAKELAYAAKKAMFAGNGKAKAMGEADGLVKVIYDPDTRKMLGCHIVGPHAADLIAEAALAISHGMTIDEVGRYTVHGHPTLGEVLKTACG